jgi:hypothetical protein
MERILDGGMVEGNEDVGTFDIETDKLYDVNDEKFMQSVQVYTEPVGTVDNYGEMRSKCKYMFIDYYDIHNYRSLSLAAKLVLLFDATSLLDSGDYVRNYDCSECVERFQPPTRGVAFPIVDASNFYKKKGRLVDSPQCLHFKWVPK